jgi:hypothetical protein
MEIEDVETLKVRIGESRKFLFLIEPFPKIHINYFDFLIAT